MRLPWRHRSSLLSPLSVLPRDIILAIVEFLMGFDIFAFSYVNRSFYDQLIGADVWAPRIKKSNIWFQYGPKALSYCWERWVYAHLESFLSSPLVDHMTTNRGIGGSTKVSPERVNTIDVWFCLTRNLHEDITSSNTVDIHCSLDPTLTVQVEFRRWYHFAWVLDHEFETIYRNGAFLERRPRQGRQAHFFWDIQVHSNIIGLGDECQGWMPFVLHGFVDDFRHWRQRLTPEQIQQLAQGDDLPVSPKKSLRGGMYVLPHQ